MKHNDQSNYSSHDDVWLLLPWYVNGSLDEYEHPLVENHLKVCVTCRGEAENLKKLSTELAYSETMDLAAGASFEHLKERIELPEEPMAPAVMNNPLKWIIGCLTGQSIWVGAPIVLVAIATVSVFFLQYNRVGVEPRAGYQTLSDKKRSALDGRAIRVEFAASMPPDRIEQIIASIDGAIQDKSSHDHIFDIRIQNNKVSGFKQLAAVVARLQDHPGVVSARPVVVPNIQIQSKRSTR